MNILHLTTWYPVPEKPNFGAFIKAHAEAVANHNQSDKHLLLSIVLRPPSDISTKEIIVEGNLQVVVVVVRSRFWKVYQHWPWWVTNQFRKLLGQYHPTFTPDVIHAHVGFPAGIAAQSLAKERNTPYLITEHWSGAIRQIKQPILGALTIQAYQKANVITAVSQQLLDDMRAAGLLIGKSDAAIKLVPNVLDPTFRYLPKPTTRQFLVLMNLADRKRPDLIIAAMIKLKTNWPPDASVLIVGNGPYKADLQRLVNTHKLPITFRNTVTKAEVPALMQKATALWHPTEVETFGLVVAEAMACGTPVLCSGLPTLRQLANGYPNQLVENTVDAWAIAINSMLARQQPSPEALQQMATATQARFGPSEVAAQFCQIYQLLA